MIIILVIIMMIIMTIVITWATWKLEASNFWSGFVKSQKSYLVIRCRVDSCHKHVFLRIICLVCDISLGDADIQLAMIDIQIVSYQSRQKLFKIFYNILYWNQCCSPSLALTVWSYRKKEACSINVRPICTYSSFINLVIVLDSTS